MCTLTLSKNCGDLEELRQGENLQTGRRERPTFSRKKTARTDKNAQTEDLIDLVPRYDVRKQP